MKFACAIAVLLSMTVCCAPATAVLISPSYDEPNLRAPADDPGWNNVGRLNGGSAVYLGNRWVITASHVGAGSFITTDGRTLAATVGSTVRLHNTGIQSLFGQPDLEIFRLAEDPGLPAMSIATAGPAVGTRLTMIGNGRDKDPHPVGWQLTSTTNGFQWNQSTIVGASGVGFSILSTSRQRWGTNEVASGSTFSTQDAMYIYSTRFDQQRATPFEAQAVAGDSGGGVFEKIDGAWQLSGIMTQMGTLTDQPSGTAVYGDRSYIADLSSYRNEILSYVDRAEPLWQNQVNYYDVSNDGSVGPRDVLQLIDELLTQGTHHLDGTPGAGGLRYDVNGDYSVSPTDLSAVISYLASAAPTAKPAAASYQFVPEPSTGVLALLGSLVVFILRRVHRRKKRAQLA